MKVAGTQLSAAVLSAVNAEPLRIAIRERPTRWCAKGRVLRLAAAIWFAALGFFCLVTAKASADSAQDPEPSNWGEFDDRGIAVLSNMITPRPYSGVRIVSGRDVDYCEPLAEQMSEQTRQIFEIAPAEFSNRVFPDLFWGETDRPTAMQCMDCGEDGARPLADGPPAPPTCDPANRLDLISVQGPAGRSRFLTLRSDVANDWVSQSRIASAGCFFSAEFYEIDSINGGGLIDDDGGVDPTLFASMTADQMRSEFRNVRVDFSTYILNPDHLASSTYRDYLNEHVIVSDPLMSSVRLDVYGGAAFLTYWQDQLFVGLLNPHFHTIYVQSFDEFLDRRGETIDHAASQMCVLTYLPETNSD